MSLSNNLPASQHLFEVQCAILSCTSGSVYVKNMHVDVEINKSEKTLPPSTTHKAAPAQVDFHYQKHHMARLLLSEQLLH